MAASESAGGKTCVVCGKDATDRPRVKDGQGRYFHRDCYEAAKQKLQARKSVVTRAAPAAAAAPAPSRAAKPAPARVPAAAAVPRAQPVAKSPPKPAPADNADDLLTQLSSLESSAASVEAGAATFCPSCGQVIPGGGIICVGCGFNIKTGKRVAMASVALPKAKAAKPGGKKGGAGASGILGQPWVFGAGPALFFLIFFGVSKASPSLVGAYWIACLVFGFGVGIWALVKAFGDSALRGILCLCLTPYSLYYVFGVNDDSRLKYAYGASLFSAVLYVVLVGGQIAANPGLFPGAGNGGY